jgi:hypothetical protein
MSVRTLALAGLVTSLLVVVPSAVADPTTDNNKNLIQRTLDCGTAGIFPSTFVAPMGSNFNGTEGQQVFVYKYLDVGGVQTVRGIQGFENNHQLITCTYSFDSTDVTAVGFFTGPRS